MLSTSCKDLIALQDFVTAQHCMTGNARYLSCSCLVYVCENRVKSLTSRPSLLLGAAVQKCTGSYIAIVTLREVNEVVGSSLAEGTRRRLTGHVAARSLGASCIYTPGCGRTRTYSPKRGRTVTAQHCMTGNARYLSCSCLVYVCENRVKSLTSRPSFLLGLAVQQCTGSYIAIVTLPTQ